MQFASLKALRARRIADALARPVLVGGTLALATLALLVGADAAAGLPGWARATGLAAAALCALGGLALCARRLARGDWSLLATARFATARTAGAANALASFLELDASASVPQYVAARVEAAAANEAAALDPASLVDFGRIRRLFGAAATLAVALGIATIAGYDFAGRLATFPIAAARDAATPAGPSAPVDPGDRLTITIVPPSYTGAAPVRLDAPAEVVAPEGSRVDVELARGLSDVTATLAVNGGPAEAMRPGPSGALAASFVARDEGSVAVRPAGARGERQQFLLPLRVVPDRAPEVRIVAPKGDVLVDPAVRPRALAVEFEATDDYGLGPMRLVYIRSTGEGDAAEFVNGELPAVAAGRRPNGALVGQCTIDLDKLGVGAGATLVYHVEVKDRNAVSGPATGMSESLVFEVAALKPPASIVIGELRPEDLERYLVSERMILEHTIKLEGERPKLSRDAFLPRATEIAGEQRDFKESFSQFIEIHGGDDHDHDATGALTNEKAFEQAQRHASEEARAEREDPDAKAHEGHERAVEAKTEAHQHGTAGGEGGATTPLRELQLAVSAMWDAEGALGIGETANAIPHEKLAIDHLKRAQRAVRYFSRVRVTTKPVDLKRRYAGDLADIKSRIERLARRDLSPEERRLRESLEAVYRELQAATAVDPERPSADAASRAEAVAARASEVGAGLLSLETGYQPAVVAVASRLSSASADARRLADALRAGDAGRARSAFTALGDGLGWSAGQLAALLDARGSVRGGAAAPSAEDPRATDYLRRLAEGGP